MQKEIHLIFNPGRGESPLRHITAVRGDKVGAMPIPVLRGYEFVGWFTFPEGADIPTDGFGGRVSPEHIVDERLDDDTILYAHWKKLSAKDKKKTSLRNQKRAVIALAITVVLLIAALITVNYIVDIYTYPDIDGVEYTIKKNKNGKYALYLDGVLCDINHEGLYQTNSGSLVKIDADTGAYETYAVVHTSDTEQLGTNRRVLMFKQLTYDMSSTKDMSKVIKEIKLKNQHSEIRLVRGEGSRFYVVGHENLTLNDELFATLATGCGYTLSTYRLDSPKLLADGSIDLAEYGLTSETRTKIEYPEENNKDNGSLSDMADKETGVEVEYLYEPTKYTVTTMSDETYTVIIGDMTVTGGGYYAMFEGRNTIYVLAAANITDGVMLPVESILTPQITYPAGNFYYDVSDFVYRSDIDYEKIYTSLLAEVLNISTEDIESADKETLSQYEKDFSEAIKNLTDEEFSKKYDAALKEHSSIVTSFSYIELEDRENQLFSTQPFRMNTQYMKGYLPNSTNVFSVLQGLNTMQIDKVIKLAPSDDDLQKYGLDEPAHLISYYLNTEDGSVYNLIKISRKTDGVYYAYAPEYDMIVEFAEHKAAFLEWDELDWYSREFFEFNIAHIREILIEGKDFSAHFRLDNSASDKVDENGDPSLDSEKLVVYANGERLNYSLYVTKPSGNREKETADYNFRRFFSYALATASIEGTAELTDEEISEFLSSPDSECQLKLTIIGDDSDFIAKDENGNPTREANSICNVYRFYQYSERKSFMTIEALDSPEAESSPENGQGSFYVSRSFCDKILADAKRVLNAEEVVESKY